MFLISAIKCFLWQPESVELPFFLREVSFPRSGHRVHCSTSSTISTTICLCVYLSVSRFLLLPSEWSDHYYFDWRLFFFCELSIWRCMRKSFDIGDGVWTSAFHYYLYNNFAFILYHFICFSLWYDVSSSSTSIEFEKCKKVKRLTPAFIDLLPFRNTHSDNPR